MDKSKLNPQQGNQSDQKAFTGLSTIHSAYEGDSAVTYPDVTIQSEMLASSFTFGNQTIIDDKPQELEVSFAPTASEINFLPSTVSFIKDHNTPYGGFTDSTIVLDDKTANPFHQSALGERHQDPALQQSAAFFQAPK